MNKKHSVRVPIDFFDYSVIKQIEAMEYGDELIIFFFELWFEVEQQKIISGKYEYRIRNATLTDDLLKTVFELKHWSATEAFNVFTPYGMAIREEKRIIIIPFWLDKRDTTSPEYIFWRKAILERDGYRCQNCGAKKQLQAHHIIPWKDRSNKALRYDIDNGITLCRCCHLKAHGGSWR